MTIQDTYKHGSLYVDANNTVDFLEDQGLLTDRVGEVLEQFQESHVDFHFDADWPHARRYNDDESRLPMIELGWFGGYPGEALDDANAQAALEWAEDREHIVAYSSWFGGCQSVQLLFDPTNSSLSDAEEAVELAEGFAEYPVLDEDLWSQLEMERFSKMLDEMIVGTENDRDIVFTEDQRRDLEESAQNYYGYWEEGYFPEDKWDEIVAEALGDDRQLHQETKLW